MGLDIYLRKCADLDAATAAMDAAEEEVNKAWDAAGVPYEQLTEQQKNSIRNECDAIYAKHGCTGKHNRHESIESVDAADSKIDPAHMFKLNYFRSSYNEGGIERVLRNLGLPTLHDIFLPPDDRNDFRPDWEGALDRVNASIAAFDAHLASPMGMFGITHVRPMFEYGAKDEAGALALFAEQLKVMEGREGGWSNRDGEFFCEPLRVRAVITRTFERDTFSNPFSALLNRPSVFVVYEKQPEEGKEDWYLTALRIVRESIEYVLAQPDKQHYYLVWSG